jgi:hypothetical protein
MATQGTGKKRVVWQDIRPAVATPKPIIKKIPRVQKIRTLLSSLQKFTVFKKIKNKITRLSKKHKIITLLVCAFAIVFIGYYIIKIQNNATTNTHISNQTTNIRPVLKQGTPSYSTVIPTGKSISQLGGWTRVSPSSSDPSYAYVDKIGSTAIIVSQQPLPNDFKNDTARKVEQLAQGFNADAKITVGDTPIYIGTSSSGSQSIIFTKNNLLILIKSNDKISNDNWAKYISSLQ